MALDFITLQKELNLIKDKLQNNFRIITENKGLILRKRFDRFHGRQRARVFVDGQFAGWWYEAGENRIHRWGVTDFGIDGRFTKGKDSVLITIEPPAGVPLWSVSRLDLFALTLP